MRHTSKVISMTNELIFDLSKESPVLAHDEILSCLDAEDHPFKITTYNENVMIIRSNIAETAIKNLAKRLSMSFSIGRFLFKSTPHLDTIKQKANDHPLTIDGSLAIQNKNRSSTIHSTPIIHTLADVYTNQRTVDLNNPDHIVFAMITDETIFVSIQLAKINRSDFEKRKAHLRPFFSPISLHPKIARALVNISQVKKGDTLLDPFCGTGGILIEAGLLGVNVIGNDLSEKMIHGAIENLKQYQVKPYQMITGDIEMISKQINGSVDAVVTDLPYGKAASTKGEAIQELHGRSMQCIQNVLKPLGKAVIGTTSARIDHWDSQEMIHITSYPLRVHRSLTRWFHVFEHRP